MNWQEFWNTILNGMDLERFLAYFVMMVLGAFVNFTIDVRRSMKKDIHVPKKFKFLFLIKDNFFRGLAVAIILVVMILYFEDWFDTPLNGKIAFAFGLTIDTIIGQILSEGKEAPILKRSREKLLKKYE